jgi:tetratricopeptide (TPR) repeat protein
MRHALVSAALLLSACGGGMPDIRAHPLPESLAVSRFESAYGAGKRHWAADRVGLALVSFQAALAADPLSVAALNAVAAAYDELRRPDLARGYYAKALAIEPESADTLNNMAISAALAGDDRRAAELFARAAVRDGANATIRANLRLAGLAPAAPSPSDSGILAEALAAAGDDQPQLERTGLAEFTLVLPASAIEAMPLAAPEAPERPVAAIAAAPAGEPRPAPAGD